MNIHIFRFFKHPLMRLLNGILYIWIFMENGFNFASVLFCLCTSMLIMVSVIDWATYEIPIECNIAIGILGVIRGITDLTHWYHYVIGFFAVSSIFLLIFILSKGSGIGGGDVKLMAVAGLLIGWQKIMIALAIGAIVGLVIHVSLMIVKGKERMLAFGPYLALGIIISMLYGDRIMTWC